MEIKGRLPSRSCTSDSALYSTFSNLHALQTYSPSTIFFTDLLFLYNILYRLTLPLQYSLQTYSSSTIYATLYVLLPTANNSTRYMILMLINSYNVNSKMTAIWTPFCGISGQKHNDNIIECVDCKAQNPRIQPREVVDISDDDTTVKPAQRTAAISVYSGALHPAYQPADRKRPKQSRLTTIRRTVNQGEAAGPDRVYRVVVNFYLSHYDIVDEL